MNDFLHRMRSLFRRNEVEDEMKAELRFHLEREAEKMRGAGVPAAQAQREARLRLGGLTQTEEECREARGTAHLESIAQDARFAVRMLRKSPGFTAVAVLTLGLGIGINSAIFSLVYHVLLQPLPYPHPEQLYEVWARSPSSGDARTLASGPDFLDYHDQNKSFSAMAEFIPSFSETWTGDGEPRVLNFAGPTQEFYSMMGVKPFLGRLYAEEDFSRLDGSNMLVSYRFWKNQLSADPHVIGRVVHIGGSEQTIIGVLPDMPDLFPTTDAWATLTTHPSWPFMQWRTNKFLTVIGRLKAGVTPAMATDDLTAILRRAPGEPKDVRVELVPLKEAVVGSVKAQLQIILGAVSLVLLVTCINLAALLLARSVKRAPEMALRTSLGASSPRLTQQLMIEGLLLTGVAGAAGVALGWAGLRLLPRIPGLGLPRLAGVHLNAAALAATGAVAVLTALLFGWAPSLTFSRLELAATLRSGRTETGRSHRRWFAYLVSAEVACSVVLAVGAGLLLRSFWQVERVDPGFQPERMMEVYLRTNFYDKDGPPFWQGVLQSVATLPGVRAAAVADCMPGRGAATAALMFDDRANDPDHAPAAKGCWTSADFFRVSGTALLKGRAFGERDTSDAPPVAIINSEAARQFWPGQDPIGRRIGVNYTGPGRRTLTSAPRMREIVGVVHAVKLGALEAPAAPAVYLPYLQDETYHDMASMSLFVRSAGNPATLADSIRTRIHGVSANQPVQDFRTMEDLMALQLAPRRYSLLLVAAFAGLALVLAALGIYGVVAYTTSMRTREFGVRVALGATPARLLGCVFREGLAFTLAGAVAGAAAAALGTRLLAQMLFQVSPLDPVTFAAALGVMAMISLAACLVPAWRASRADPLAALRSE